MISPSGQAGEGDQDPASTADRADIHQPLPDLGREARGGAQDWSEQGAGRDIATNINISPSSQQQHKLRQEMQARQDLRHDHHPVISPSGLAGECAWAFAGRADGADNHHPVRQCPTKPGPVARYVGLQLENANVQNLMPTYYPKGPLTDSTGCATGRDAAIGGCHQDGLTGRPGTDRMDQGAIEKSSASLNSIQCHTIQWPVLRYVGVQSDIIVDNIITRNICLENEEEVNPKKSSRRVEDDRAENPKDEDDSRMMENLRRMEDENSRRKESHRGAARTMSHPAIWTEVRKDKATLEKQYRWKELATTEQRKLEKDGKTRRVEIEKIKRRKYGKAGKSKLTALEEVIMAGLARRMKEIAEIEKNMHLQKTRPKGWKVDHEEQGTMPTSDIVPEGRMVRKHDESDMDGK